MLVEHLELICRPTHCGSVSGDAPLRLSCQTHGTNRIGFAACNFQVTLVQEPFDLGEYLQQTVTLTEILNFVLANRAETRGHHGNGKRCKKQNVICGKRLHNT